MNNEGHSHHEDSFSADVDWASYKRYLYEISEKESLISTSEPSSSITDLSSESFEIPFGKEFLPLTRAKYSPKDHSVVSFPYTTVSQQDALSVPRPAKEMASPCQGDESDKKTSAERSRVKGSSFEGRQTVLSECCSQCKEQTDIPRVTRASSDKFSLVEEKYPYLHERESRSVCEYTPHSHCSQRSNRSPIQLKPAHLRCSLLESPHNSHYNNTHCAFPENALPRNPYTSEPWGPHRHNGSPLLREHNNSTLKTRRPTLPAERNLFTISENKAQKVSEEVLVQRTFDNKHYEEPPEGGDEGGCLREATNFTRRESPYVVDINNSSNINMCICGEEINRLRKELLESKNHIMAISMQMEEQSSHLHQLIEERRKTQQKKNSSYRQTDMNCAHTFAEGAYNTGQRGVPSYDRHSLYTLEESSERSSFPADNYNDSSQNFGLRRGPSERERYFPGLDPALVSELSRDPKMLSNLKDQIIALQMHNIQLNIFLKKEEERRQEAEADLEKERNYIKKLEDNIKNIRSSQVVMDPMIYKEVADNYIAARKQPVRRTHTCMPYFGKSDLVCDARSRDSLNVHYPHSSNSCPTSPLGSKSDMTKLHKSSRLSPDEGSSLEELGSSEENHQSPWKTSVPTGSSSSLGQQEYLKLLDSLEKLNTSSPS